MSHALPEGVLASGVESMTQMPNGVREREGHFAAV
jgi:hypothetical protein